MHDKLPVLALYLIFLVFIAVTPWSATLTGRGQGQSESRVTVILLGLIAAVSVYVAVAPRELPLLRLLLITGLSFVLVTLSDAKKSLTLALLSIAGAALSNLLLWWVAGPSITALQVLLVMGLWGLLAAVFSTHGIKDTDGWIYISILVALTLGCWIIMRWGSFETRTHWFTSWHHWGAYWGPVETVKAGLIPFADIPLQYGAGPTAILSMLPVKNGFDGMRHAVTLISLIGIWVVVDLCMLGVKPLKSHLALFAAGLSGSIACLLWTALPSSVGTLMITPSTFGLRFVPIFVLLWTLIRFPSQVKLHYLVWICCTLWSIESAFYACVIFWPSRFRFASGNSLRETLVEVGRVALLALSVTAGLVGVWWLFFTVIYGVPPSPRLYVLYALFPPGAMSVNWYGPVWVLFSCLVIAACVLHSQRVAISDKRVIHLSALSLLGCTTYYLGRSHDNNILNLMPALTVLLCALVGKGREAGFFSFAARPHLIAVLAMLPFFGFGNWHVMRPAPDGAWSHTMSFFKSSHPDLMIAINYVRNERNEAFEVIDDGPFMSQPAGPENIFNSLHPFSNFPFVPSADRIKMLTIGMKKLHKPGWLIVLKTRMNDPMINDFKAVYKLSEQQIFGDFIAMRMVPPSLQAGNQAVN
jgi:hypothetical protein